MSIQLRIKELRESNNLSKKDFAAVIGVDNSQYSKIEQGKLMPTIQHVMEICSNFNADSNWLLTGRESITNYDKGIKNNTSIDLLDLLATKQAVPYAMYEDKQKEIDELNKEIGRLQLLLEQNNLNYKQSAG